MVSIRSIFSKLTICIATTAIVCGTFSAPVHAKSRIEAVKGKHYGITKRHGPWMVMVASMKDISEDERRDLEEGLSAREAADELVYELRKRGIPAYTYVTDDVVDHIQMTDRLTGEMRKRAFLSQQGHVVVMAGNYNISDLKDHQSAKDTLKYIKNLKPKVLMDSKYGGVFKSTPGRPGPLSGAFLTVNPLLSPEEIQRSKSDAGLLRFNSGIKHSLLKNPGKYTLQIATFTGMSMMDKNRRNQAQEFDQKINERRSLDQASEDAWRLCEAMRQAKSIGYDTNYETWVLHENFRSIVTIGSFDSKDDPRLIAAYKFFEAKMSVDQGSPQLKPAMFTIPQQPKPGKAADAMWLMDPKPKLIEVPRIRGRR